MENNEFDYEGNPTFINKIKREIYEKYENYWPKSFLTVNKDLNDEKILISFKENITHQDTKPKVLNKLNKEMSLKAKQKLADEMHRAIDFIYILDKFNKLNFDIYKNNDLDISSATEDISFPLNEITKIYLENKNPDNKYLKLFCDFFGGKEFAEQINKFINLSNITERDKQIRNNFKKVIENNTNEKIKNIFLNIFSINKLFLLLKIRLENDYLELCVEDQNNSRLFGGQSPKEQSQGYKQIFYLIAILEGIKLIDENKKELIPIPTVVLFDEPDKNIHYSIQKELSKYLIKYINENKNILIVIATHSGFLLSEEKEENNIIITKLLENGQTEIKEYDEVKKDDNIDFDNSIFPINSFYLISNWYKKIEKIIKKSKLAFWYNEDEFIKKYNKDINIEKIKNYIKEINGNLNNEDIVLHPLKNFEEEEINYIIKFSDVDINNQDEFINIIRNIENYSNTKHYKLSPLFLNELLEIIY
ncbi:hypothetical protein GL982_03695 [Spiroplasma citri]|uniref:ATP-binding protein n=1 Tax=Spiroplasma citri TaxID=2133 RepID=UPI0013A0AABD|nr:ATP-binding protein [Spiroplasma citri]QIA72800.1 hypothetical protein GL982_03695 [Spiroplasma citri]